jgi:hypothetical protein
MIAQVNQPLFSSACVSALASVAYWADGKPALYPRSFKVEPRGFFVGEKREELERADSGAAHLATSLQRAVGKLSIPFPGLRETRFTPIPVCGNGIVAISARVALMLPQPAVVQDQLDFPANRVGGAEVSPQWRHTVETSGKPAAHTSPFRASAHSFNSLAGQPREAAAETKSWSLAEWAFHVSYAPVFAKPWGLSMSATPYRC